MGVCAMQMVIQKLVSPKAAARIANGSRASPQVGLKSRLSPFFFVVRPLPSSHPEPPKAVLY